MAPPYALGFDAGELPDLRLPVGVDPASFPETAAPRRFSLDAHPHGYSRGPAFCMASPGHQDDDAVGLLRLPDLGWHLLELLVVYASRALHLAHADVRLGLLYSAGELGGLISVVAVPVLVKRQAIGRLMAVFLAANVAAVALLAVAPSYGWALCVLRLRTRLPHGDVDRHYRKTDVVARSFAGTRQYGRQTHRLRRPAGGRSPGGPARRGVADPAHLRGAGPRRRCWRRPGRMGMPWLTPALVNLHIRPAHRAVSEGSRTPLTAGS